MWRLLLKSNAENHSNMYVISRYEAWLSDVRTLKSFYDIIDQFNEAVVIIKLYIQMKEKLTG